MSWKPAVKTVGSKSWGYNGLAFATEAEATDWGFDLSMRWTAVEDYEAHEVSDPVTHRYVNRKLEEVK